MEVGLVPGDFVFDGDATIPRKRAHLPPPNFWSMSGQTAGWMKTPLGTEVDLGRGHIVLDRVPALQETGTAAPSFRPMSIVAMVAHLNYC